MRTLRTPDDRFADLPGFGYEPRHADVPDGTGGTLRMAWVAAGPAAGPPVLLLHGEASWSFLYRKVMQVLADAGSRAWAPPPMTILRGQRAAQPGSGCSAGRCLSLSRSATAIPSRGEWRPS